MSNENSEKGIFKLNRKFQIIESLIIKTKLFPFINKEMVKNEKFNLLKNLIEQLNHQICCKSKDKNDKMVKRNDLLMGENIIQMKNLQMIIYKNLSSKSMISNFQMKDFNLKVPQTFKINNKNPFFQLKDDISEKQNYKMISSGVFYNFSDDLGLPKKFKNK